jgi:hypothetical protein
VLGRWRWLASAVALLLSACGGEPPRLGAPVSEPTLTTADDEVVERSWCGLAITYLEDDLPQVDASEPPGEVAARYRQQYFGEGAAELEESTKLAPPEISADVDRVVAGLRRAASTGDTAAVTSAEFREAKARVDSYNQRSCPRFGGGEGG